METDTSRTSGRSRRFFRSNSYKTGKLNKSKNLSSSKRVIVMYDENTAGFMEESYIEEYLGKYIKENDFEEVISYCTKKMQKLWMFVKENDMSSLPHNLKFFSLIIGAFLVGFIIGIFFVINIFSESLTPVYFSFFCYVTGISLSFGTTLYNHFRTFEKFKQPEELLKEDLDVYFKTIYTKFPGIEFNYNLKKKWIEVDVIKYRDDLSSFKRGKNKIEVDKTGKIEGIKND